MSSLQAPGDVLEGNSMEVINLFTWTALGVVFGASVVLYAGQKLQEKVLGIPVRLSHTGVSRTPNWVLFSFAGCYGLLVPGLLSPLFSFNLSTLGGNVELAQATDSMIAFIGNLWDTNCWTGAVLMVLYAVVVPASKLVLLLLSEVWRRQGPKQVMKARKCIMALQLMSKWASPDMFAYILLLFLMRSLNHRPVLDTVSQMDVGFTCFTIFCVGSTVAALGLKVPPLPEGYKEEAHASWARHLAEKPALLVAMTALFFAAFLPLLVAGCAMAVMSLDVDLDGVFEPNGSIPLAMKPLVENLHIAELAHGSVSIWDCVSKLAGWTAEGEATSFMGLILFAVCVIFNTVLGMVLLLVSSLQVWYRPAREISRGGGQGPSLPIRMAWMVKKLSFLDVSIVGVVIVVLSGQSYKTQGLILNLKPGLLLLFLAELCYYAAHFMVLQADKAARQSREAQPKASAEQDAEQPLPSLLLESGATTAMPEDGAKRPRENSPGDVQSPELAQTREGVQAGVGSSTAGESGDRRHEATADPAATVRAGATCC